MAAAKPTVKAAKLPAMTEVSVSYSIGVKCNMDRMENGKKISTYESSDYHFSKTERYNVEGLDEVVVAKFCDERYELLKEELDAKAMEVYAETSFWAQEED
jgi:hypothetical protein